MNDLIPYLLIGITTGSVYALAALGLVLTFKTSGLFNFAHGAQAALAAYIMFEFRDRMGWPWPLAFLAALGLAGIVAGLVLERIARSLAQAPVVARVGATVGLMLGIQTVLIAIFGFTGLQTKSFMPTRLWSVGGVFVRYEQVIITVLVLLAGVGLSFFLGRTRIGTSMQAVVDDPGLLALAGTNPTAVRRTAWVIGSCFAAVSGMLLAPTAGVDATVLTLLVFYAFGAAAVGGFLSLPLTYAGGIGIGVGSALLTRYLNSDSQVVSAIPSTLPFLVLFAALLIAPKSMLAERGSQVVRRALPPIRFSARARAAGLAVMGAGLLAVPHVVTGPRLPAYMTALGYGLMFLSLSLLVRTSGQISLCHMAFAAVGAATFARAMDAGLPWGVAVLAGGMIAAPVGAIVAIPAIRLSGVYLAIATFGFGLLMQNLVFPSSIMFGSGTQTLAAPRPVIPGLSTRSDTGYYYVLLGVVVACTLIVSAIRRGRLGRLLRGLADQPVAVDAHGANTNVTRLAVFCISAFFAGVAGALLAPVTGSLASPTFHYFFSLLLVAVLFMAGRQPVLGAALAAVMYILVPTYITQPTVHEYVPAAFGAGALIAAMVGGRPILSRLGRSQRTAERATRSPVRHRSRPAMVPKTTGGAA